MKKIYIHRWLVCFLLLLANVSAYTEETVALIIGNNNYTSVMELQKALTLHRGDIKVTALYNVDSTEMHQAIEQFENQLNGVTTGIFYYSGEGLSFKGENYLLPELPNNINQLLDKAIPMKWILSILSKAKKGFIIIDGYGAVPWHFRTQQDVDIFQNIEVTNDVPVVYATDIEKGKTETRNNLFTRKMIPFIEKQDLSFEEIIEKTKEKIEREAKKEEKAREEEKAILKISSNVTWVEELIINGNNKGRVNLPFEIQLSSKKYNIELKRRGYEDGKKEIILNPGSYKHIEIPLAITSYFEPF